MTHSNLIQDIADMHAKFGVNRVVATLSPEQLNTYLKFRLDMVQEEVTETHDAFLLKDADNVVDGLIDAIVFAIGTLDVLGVDTAEAWRRVHAANMAKQAGPVDATGKKRKPEGWQPPDIAGELRRQGWTP